MTVYGTPGSEQLFPPYRPLSSGQHRQQPPGGRSFLRVRSVEESPSVSDAPSIPAGSITLLCCPSLDNGADLDKATGRFNPSQSSDTIYGLVLPTRATYIRHVWDRWPYSNSSAQASDNFIRTLTAKLGGEAQGDIESFKDANTELSPSYQSLVPRLDALTRRSNEPAQCASTKEFIQAEYDACPSRRDFRIEIVCRDELLSREPTSTIEQRPPEPFDSDRHLGFLQEKWGGTIIGDQDSLTQPPGGLPAVPVVSSSCPVQEMGSSAQGAL